MAMQFTLQIDCGDDALAGGGTQQRNAELARLLRVAADMVTGGVQRAPLIDWNGNTVGRFELEGANVRYTAIGSTPEVQARRNALFAAYEQALRALHASGVCTWPLSRLNEVALRGFEQIEKGLADTKSPTVRATCNALGIACTRAAIKRYLAGGGA